jgi:predicted ATP-dependent endonuclease of OLD family
MKIIEKIEIKNFRSFGNRKKEKVEVIHIEDLNIISGANDSGKSNILRALNLFFNKNTDLNTFFDFHKDFFKKDNSDNDDVKQEMTTIKIHFLNINNKDKNHNLPLRVFLPEKFWVSRKFKRNCEYSNYDQTSGIEISFKKEKGNINYPNFLNDGKIKPPTIASLKNQLTNFLSSIQYHYIPAIKDMTYFSHLYGELQQTLWKEKNSTVLRAKEEFENAIQTTTESLMDDFKSIVSIEQNFTPLFKLPQDLINLFKTLDVNTGKVDLTLRGDGIQAKLIPEILYFIAKKEKLLTTTNVVKGAKSKKYFIWGFEEPENSYEYKNAQLLASRFRDVFSNDVQIFLTTHSFNFLSITGDIVSTYRVWKDNIIDSSRITKIKKNRQGQFSFDNSIGIDDEEKLKEELGIFELNNKLEEVYLKIETERENLLSKTHDLKVLISQATKPLLISEGYNKKFLEKAKEFYLNSFECDILNVRELGDTEMLKLFKFLLKTQNHEPKKIFILDCDSIKIFNSMERIKTDFLIPFIFDNNIENIKVKKGIENLFNVDLFTDEFYDKRIEINDYGASTTIESFNKNNFESFICKERNQVEDFNNFKPLFKFIEEQL